MREITLSKLSSQNGESINPKNMKLEVPLDLCIQEEVKQPANQKVQNYKVIQNMMNSNVSIQYQQFQNNAPV